MIILRGMYRHSETPQTPATIRRVFPFGLPLIARIEGASLAMKMHDGHQVEIVIEGAEDRIKRVITDVRDQELHLLLPAEAAAGHNTISITKGNFSSVIVGGSVTGCIIVDGVDVTSIVRDAKGGKREAETRVTVLIPRDSSSPADLTFSGTSTGEIEVLFPGSQLKAEDSSSVRVNSSYAKAVKAEDSASVTVDRMAGDTVKLRTEDSATLTVRRGEVAFLDAKATDAGSLRFMGTAKDGRLRAKDASSLHVARFQNQPQKKKDVAASLSVGQVG